MIFGIDFGPLFLTFGLQNGSQTAPKSVQNPPKCMTFVDGNMIFARPGSKMLQNGPRDSKSHLFGLQNDPQSSKNDPKTTPRAPKTIPKRSQNSKYRPKIFKNYSNHTLHFTRHTLYTHHTLHSALHTLHFTLCTLHFTLCTSHFTLYTFTLDTLLFVYITRYSPAVCAKRLNKKCKMACYPRPGSC